MEKLLRNIYRLLREEFFSYKRKPYIEELGKYFDLSTSIISSNCFAGRIYTDLGISYLSPTIGLYFFSEDYVEFVRNFRYYIKSELTFVESSRYNIGNERRRQWKHWYPIGLLGGKVEIQFLHYKSEEEAKQKWDRRCRRINLNNIVFIGSEQNLCSYEEIKNFVSLSSERSFFFIAQNYNLPKTILLPEYKGLGEVGDPYRQGHIYYKHMLEYLKEHHGQG